MKPKRFKKKIYATFIFSLVAAVVLIIHGLFLDLDFESLGRLTLSGFILTFIMVFIGLLILEWIFTIDEDEEIQALKKRLVRLEKKKK